MKPSCVACLRAAALSALFCFGMAAFAAASPAEQKTDEEPVKVLVLRGPTLSITPETLTVQRGTTIIWFNRDPEPVTVSFDEPLGPACKVPVNFYANLEGVFETGVIPQSGIASLCIVTQGAYGFTVQRMTMKEANKPKVEIAKGKIIVR